MYVCGNSYGAPRRHTTDHCMVNWRVIALRRRARNCAARGDAAVPSAAPRLAASRRAVHERDEQRGSCAHPAALRGRAEAAPRQHQIIQTAVNCIHSICRQSVSQRGAREYRRGCPRPPMTGRRRARHRRRAGRRHGSPATATTRGHGSPATTATRGHGSPAHAALRGHRSPAPAALRVRRQQHGGACNECQQHKQRWRHKRLHRCVRGPSRAAAAAGRPTVPGKSKARRQRPQGRAVRQCTRRRPDL